MAKLVSPPQRFTKEEWIISNHNKFSSAQNQRAAAERIRAEADRLVDETDERALKNTQETNKRLDQRIEDISYWKSEVYRAKNELVDETDKLAHFKVRVERALTDTENRLAIAQQCLVNREGRIGIDLVHDDVQRNLMKEVEIICGVRSLFLRTIEEAKEQMRRNRASIQCLMKDTSDKASALKIDETCWNMTTDSAEIAKLLEECLTELGATSTPVDWESFSNENILKAEREKENSIRLRAMIDGYLVQAQSDMEQIQEEVDVQFIKRIKETKDSKAELEENLAKVDEEIEAMECSIAKLQVKIKEKNGPLALALARIQERHSRPNIEECKDAAYFRLIQEVEELKKYIEQLEITLEQSHAQLRGLIRNKLGLTEDIQVKAHTLSIDEGQCQPIRCHIVNTVH